MTATALAYDLAFDTGPFAPSFAPSFVEPFADRRNDRVAPPQLAMLPGGAETAVALAPAADPVVEMYRRRRFMAALALTAFVLLVAQLAGLSVTSFGPLSTSVDQANPVVHVVAPGDTYGGIAASMGAEHPQSFALFLEASNADAELVVGQRLVVDRTALQAGN